MKQQFFVGDKVVRKLDHDTMYGGLVNTLYTVTKVVDEWTVELDNCAERCSFYYEIVERKWQKNTGKQPVDDGIDVLVKRTDSTISRAEACMFDWSAGDIGGIVEWRIADSVSSNEEQPEAIPPSHVALGDNLVFLGSEPIQQDKKHSHYFKKCGYDYVDVYRILKMFDVTDPCISHACKKLLVSGGRGFKNIDHDIQDVIDTLVRWQEMRKEDSGEH